MMLDDETARARWRDAVFLAALVAMGPAISAVSVVRGSPGPVRDRWLALLQSAMPERMTLARLQMGASEERIFGGLDMAATLASGRPVHQAGLVAAAANGLLIVPMAERLPPDIEARLSLAIDACAGNGAPGLVLFDESIGDECLGPCFRDRCGGSIDLDGLTHTCAEEASLDRTAIERAARLWSEVGIERQHILALCQAAELFGIGSMRAPSLAAALARASAALDGRSAVCAGDLEIAARLVLAPKAVRLPSPEGEEDTDVNNETPPDRQADGESPGDESDASTPPEPEVMELVLAAVRAVLPDDVLAEKLRTHATRRPGSGTGRVGEVVPRRGRGRRLRASRRPSQTASKIDILETLRIAIPWQTLRRGSQRTGRVALLPSDLRFERRACRSESAVVFLVDASGSSALHRLAEAKGAVELLLSDCYARRENVALVAFRGRTAEVLLAPTRALARARRSLASLPGGGGTPLATGLQAAHEVVRSCMRRGQKAFLVVLTDGRANIDRNGRQGRAAAEADATFAAQQIASDRIDGILIDTGPRASPEARRIAEAMHARYRPLPHADARRLHEAVNSARTA